jgi:hypothetical protein
MSPSMTLGRERMGLNLLFESFNCPCIFVHAVQYRYVLGTLLFLCWVFRIARSIYKS